MYISFYLDGDFYSGNISCEADDTYKADFGNKLGFVLFMDDDAMWNSTSRINKNIIRAAGNEVERHNNAFETEPMALRHYYSKMPKTITGQTGNSVTSSL